MEMLKFKINPLHYVRKLKRIIELCQNMNLNLVFFTGLLFFLGGGEGVRAVYFYILL